MARWNSVIYNNPLDVFVWNSIKDALKQVPHEQRNTQIKLQAALTKTIADLAGSSAWIKQVARTCKSSRKRLAWVAANEGKQIVGKPWRK